MNCFNYNNLLSLAKTKEIFMINVVKTCKYCGEDFNAKSFNQTLCSMKCRILSQIKVDEKTGCWNWIGSEKRGYGRVSEGGKWYFAHRSSYKTFKGDTKGKFVCHTCDNPMCVNPEHLVLGNNKENMLDAFKKDRMKTKLKIEDIKRIHSLLPILTTREIAKIYNVSYRTISSIRQGATWIFYDEKKLGE